MSKAIRIVLRWLPALVVMFTIFVFSSQSASELPDFDWADRLVKKGGHMVGYALLTVSYWRALCFRREKWWLAWGFALFYALTDEYHQSFVPGRSPSIWDIVIFDNLGALFGLGVWALYKTQRPDPFRPIVEEADLKRQ